MEKYGIKKWHIYLHKFRFKIMDLHENKSKQTKFIHLNDLNNLNLWFLTWGTLEII